MEKKNNYLLFICAWLAVLLVSDLPNAVLVRLAGNDPAWLSWAKIGVPIIALVLCLLLKTIRPLWQFSFVFLVFKLADATSIWISNTPFWLAIFGASSRPYFIYFSEAFIRDMGITLLVIAALWIVKRDRTEFFLVKGELNAPLQPVKWLGIKEGESWRTFGWIFTVGAGLAIFITMAFSVPLTSEAFARALRLLPLALIFAAINAFTEEVYFRASMLSTLRIAIGEKHALLLTVVFFGMAHFLYGTPPGILGFLLTGFLAFLLGKSMLETKGILWAWIMHFVPDVFIFLAYAMTWD